MMILFVFIYIFLYFQSLAWLDLSNNHLVRIEGGSFSALPKLRWLDLSNNSPFNSGERGMTIFKGLERRLSHLGLKNVSLVSVSVIENDNDYNVSDNNLTQIGT